MLCETSCQITQMLGKDSLADVRGIYPVAVTRILQLIDELTSNERYQLLAAIEEQSSFTTPSVRVHT
jgi:hypothetical protein